MGDAAHHAVRIIGDAGAGGKAVDSGQEAVGIEVLRRQARGAGAAGEGRGAVRIGLGVDLAELGVGPALGERLLAGRLAVEGVLEGALRDPAVEAAIGVSVGKLGGVGDAVEQDVIEVGGLVEPALGAGGGVVVGELLDTGRRGDGIRVAVRSVGGVVDERRPLGHVVEVGEVVAPLDRAVEMAARVEGEVILMMTVPEVVRRGLRVCLPGEKAAMIVAERPRLGRSRRGGRDLAQAIAGIVEIGGGHRGASAPRGLGDARQPAEAVVGLGRGRRRLRDTRAVPAGAHGHGAADALDAAIAHRHVVRVIVRRRRVGRPDQDGAAERIVVQVLGEVGVRAALLGHGGLPTEGVVARRLRAERAVGHLHVLFDRPAQRVVEVPGLRERDRRRAVLLLDDGQRRQRRGARGRVVEVLSPGAVAWQDVGQPP